MSQKETDIKKNSKTALTKQQRERKIIKMTNKKKFPPKVQKPVEYVKTPH